MLVKVPVGNLRGAEARAGGLEAAYVRDLTSQAYASLQEALRDVSLLHTSITKLYLLHQSQRIFEQGERSGRLLAWLSREYSSPVSISRIRSPDGEVLTDPSQINKQFAAYYQELYSSKVRFTEPELQAYLEGVNLPCLTEATRERLDSPITLKELQLAVKSLQGGKTPGPEGYPAEFYKQYADDILPIYREVLLKTLESGTLPPSMSEAVIVVLPKPGKDPGLCSSYQPISLLNVDLKILAKVLAGRLNSVITALIHPDRSGFMPGRGTDINIRRLLTHIDAAPGDSP